jgi:hypothetical protein
MQMLPNQADKDHHHQAKQVAEAADNKDRVRVPKDHQDYSQDKDNNQDHNKIDFK